MVFDRSSDGSSLYEVSSSGGVPHAITTVASAPGETIHAWPQILPGRAAVLFAVLPARKIVVQSLQTRTRHELADGTDPRYVPGGHIVFVRDASIWALPFDLARLAATGPAFPVVADVGAALDRSHVFTVSDNGTLVYVRGQAVQTRRLVWVDSAGREEPIPAEPRLYDSPRLSPDGQRVALRVQESVETNPDIWVYDLARDTQTQLTFDPAVDIYPIWTPDGQRIVFSSGRAGARNLFWQPADGTGQAEQLTSSPLLQSPWTWSGDTTSLVLQENDPKTGWDLSLLATKGDRRTQKLINTESSETSAAISPSGEWIVYHSNDSGRNEVYVRPFPKVADGMWKVSGEGGTDARWSPNGRQIFYLSLDGRRMMAVPVTTERGFSSGRSKMLFEGEYHRTSGVPSYDVSPDGRRFLMIKEGGVTDPLSVRQELIVVLNWLEELKARVPTK